MNFPYSKQNLRGRERLLHRLFEIFPGLASWGIILGGILLSFFQPLTAAIVFLAFYLYWLLRILYLTIFLALSYFRLKIEAKTDWMERIEEIDRLRAGTKSLDVKSTDDILTDWISFSIHRRQLQNLHKNGELPCRSRTSCTW